MSRRLTDKQRRDLVGELTQVKDRLRRHGIEVAYSRGSHTLREHIADIKRRDVIEAQLIEDHT